MITAGTHMHTTPEDHCSLTFGPLCDEVDALVACRALHADRLALNRTELVRVFVGKVVGLLYRHKQALRQARTHAHISLSVPYATSVSSHDHRGTPQGWPPHRTEDAAFPFDEETGAVPNTLPLQLCRHSRF